MDERVNSVRIRPGVRLGQGITLGDFLVLGELARGRSPGEVETVIGDGATIRSHTVIYAGTRIGNRLETGHGVLIREDGVIGDDVSIGSHTVIEHQVKIGNGVRIHSNAFIPELTVLEDGCWIGPNVVMANSVHPLCQQSKSCLRAPRIRRGAKIGANATILPGVTVGCNALVGAGTVVNKDVPDFAVVVGNPARVINRTDELICPYGFAERCYGGDDE